MNLHTTNLKRTIILLALQIPLLSIAPQAFGTLKEKKPGLVQKVAVHFRADVPAATVFVNGDNVGRTPTTLSLTVGIYSVEVRKAGHVTWRREIRLDEETTVYANLAESPPPVSDYPLKLSSNIPSANIYIDNRYVGTGATQIRLQPGRYRFRMEAPGYVDYLGEISIPNDTAVRIRMQPAMGRVSVVFPEDRFGQWKWFQGLVAEEVEILVDGIRMNELNFYLPPGRHFLRLNVGPFSQNKILDVEAGEEYEVSMFMDLRIRQK